MTKKELLETIEKLTKNFSEDTVVRFQTENEDLYEPDDSKMVMRLEGNKEIIIFDLCELWRKTGEKMSKEETIEKIEKWIDKMMSKNKMPTS